MAGYCRVANERSDSALDGDRVTGDFETDLSSRERVGERAYNEADVAIELRLKITRVVMRKIYSLSEQ